MAVSLADIALDLRLITVAAQPITAGHTSILTRLRSTAESMVLERAPLAPVALRDQAVIAIAAYLFDKPTAAPGNRYSNAWTNSGASVFLAAHVSRVARAIGRDTDEDGEPAQPGGVVGVDQVARAAAAEALAAAEAAALVAAGKITEARALELIQMRINALAEDAAGTVTIEDGRLPGPAVVMRLGWGQSQAFTADSFIRADNHPLDGAAIGDTDGLAIPPWPPAFADDASLFLGIWVAGDPLIVAVDRSGYLDGEDGIEFFPSADKYALQVDGAIGHVYPSTVRDYPFTGEDILSLLLGGGPLIITEDNIDQYAPTTTDGEGGGGTPVTAVRMRAAFGRYRGSHHIQVQNPETLSIVKIDVPPLDDASQFIVDQELTTALDAAPIIMSDLDGQATVAGSEYLSRRAYAEPQRLDDRPTVTVAYRAGWCAIWIEQSPDFEYPLEIEIEEAAKGFLDENDNPAFMPIVRTLVFTPPQPEYLHPDYYSVHARPDYSGGSRFPVERDPKRFWYLQQREIDGVVGEVWIMSITVESRFAFGGGQLDTAFGLKLRAPIFADSKLGRWLNKNAMTLVANMVDERQHDYVELVTVAYSNFHVGTPAQSSPLDGVWNIGDSYAAGLLFGINQDGRLVPTSKGPRSDGTVRITGFYQEHWPQQNDLLEPPGYGSLGIFTGNRAWEKDSAVDISGPRFPPIEEVNLNPVSLLGTGYLQVMRLVSNIDGPLTGYLEGTAAVSLATLQANRAVKHASTDYPGNTENIRGVSDWWVSSNNIGDGSIRHNDFKVPIEYKEGGDIEVGTAQLHSLNLHNQEQDRFRLFLRLWVHFRKRLTRTVIRDLDRSS